LAGEWEFCEPHGQQPRHSKLIFLPHPVKAWYCK
jgi:hypothetical protein